MQLSMPECAGDRRALLYTPHFAARFATASRHCPAFSPCNSNVNMYRSFVSACCYTVTHARLVGLHHHQIQPVCVCLHGIVTRRVVLCAKSTTARPRNYWCSCPCANAYRLLATIPHRDDVAKQPAQTHKCDDACIESRTQYQSRKYMHIPLLAWCCASGDAAFA